MRMAPEVSTMRNGLSRRIAALEARRPLLPDAEPAVRELPSEQWWHQLLMLINTSEHRQAILDTLGLTPEGEDRAN
jgi:hypothetical protein